MAIRCVPGSPPTGVPRPSLKGNAKMLPVFKPLSSAVRPPDAKPLLPLAECTSWSDIDLSDHPSARDVPPQPVAEPIRTLRTQSAFGTNPWTPRDVPPQHLTESIHQRAVRDELVKELQAHFNERFENVHQLFNMTLAQHALEIAVLQKLLAGHCEKMELETIDDKLSRFEDNLQHILGQQISQKLSEQERKMVNLEANVDNKISKLEDNLQQIFAQQIGQKLSEQECKTVNHEANVDNKISKLEDAVAAGIADMNCVKQSLEELADGLEDAVHQSISSGLESLGKEVADIREQLQEDGLKGLTEDSPQRASSCKSKVHGLQNSMEVRQEIQDPLAQRDVIQNCIQVQQEIQATLAQCVVQFKKAEAEREEQSRKISNFEARMDLKVSNLDATITAGLANTNSFNASPMAFIGFREKQRLMNDIEAKLRLTTSVMENEIVAMRADMKGLQKAAHNWHEFKKKTGDGSNESSTRVSSDSGEECEVSDGST